MDDIIKDRGTKKWNSIMLPEHVEAVKQVFAEEERKEKPILDEQQKMEIDANIKRALRDNMVIEITYYADYDYKKVSGNLLSVDVFQGSIKLDDDRMTEIKFADILDVVFLS
ncbi:MAG TPA: YolD-like family protein [Bacillota bacterium]